MSVIPHKGHDVTQWLSEPVAGYSRTKWYCWDCDEHGDTLFSRAKLQS